MAPPRTPYRMTAVFTVKVARGVRLKTPRLIRADWPGDPRKGRGGPYIELTFGAHSPYAPTEVINVYDYEKGESSIPYTRTALRVAVRDWMLANDREWPEWYEDYLENQRYYA